MMTKTTGWTYKGQPFTESDYEALSDDVRGFVYLITDTITGDCYVGQKLVKSTRKKSYTTKKGTRRRRKTIVESDWRNYWSSNDVIKERVAGGDTDRYTREILRFGYSRGDLSYLEMVEQVNRGVLFTPKYLNGIINVRIHHKHISERLKKELGYGNQPEKP